LKSESKVDRDIRIDHVFFSFEENREGSATLEELTFIDPETGMPGDSVEETLKAGSEADWVLRATDAYPDKHANETMYITLILAVGEEQVVIRQSGTIIVAH
jgi:hypothetical protein